MIHSQQTVIVKYKPKMVRKRRPVYNHPKRQPMSVKILDMIESRGGMTATQIKRQLWEWSHPGQKYDNSQRGWWSTNLYGAGQRRGLLHHFCTKEGNKWIRNKVPHNDKPFKTMSDASNKWKATRPVVS